MPTHEPQNLKALLNLLVRAAEMIEEVYRKNPELIHDDLAQDYKDIMTALKNNGAAYKPNPQILQMAHDFDPYLNSLTMPMVKAGGKGNPAGDQVKSAS